MSSATTTPSGSNLDQGDTKTAAASSLRRESMLQNLDAEMRRASVDVDLSAEYAR